MRETTITMREISAEELVEGIAERLGQIFSPILRPQQQRDPDDLVNLKEAAGLLRVSPSSISRYAKSGHLRKRRAGKRVLFRVGDLLSFTQEHSV